MNVRLCALLLPVALVACAAAPDAEPVGDSTSNITAGDEAVVSVDELNLRAGPSTDDAILAVMKSGERIHVRGDAQNGFLPVTYNGIDGWAYADYVNGIVNVAIGSLADAVNALAAEAPRRSPGTELGIAVRNLTTGEYAGAGDDVRHVSASSAKVIWVAAALHHGAGVGDIAPGIFKNSDNGLAGTAIDRAGGIDAVNDFYWNTVGMPHSITANWSFGGVTRHASVQGQMGGDNYFTPQDTIRFLTNLDNDSLLGGAKSQELETYMTWSPRSGYGGWLGTLLPAEARAQMMHKAGWLPAPDYSDSTCNEIGIVQVPGGERYAISLLAHHGADYARETSFVERASCVVYRTIAKDSTIGCRD